MNLKDIRTQLFRRLDWDPSPTEDAVARFNSFVERASQQLALEAPFLFFESTVRFTTMAPAESFDDGDTIRMIQSDDAPGTPQNPWVFFTSRTVGDPDITEWKTDRSWDGRHIQITDADGVVHTNQIRSVWVEQVSATDRYHFSLVKPWPYTLLGVGPFTWRVYTDAYYLPDDVISLKSARVVGGDSPGPLTVAMQGDVEASGIDDGSGLLSNVGLRSLYRKGHFQLPGPNSAPIEVDTTLNWRGPDPPGEFEYCCTYTWGKRDYDYTSSNPGYWATDGESYSESSGVAETTEEKWDLNRYREPLFESAPSPVLEAEVLSVDETGETTAIQIAVPNPEFAQGFMASVTNDANPYRRIHSNHSGLHVRIYRRRKTYDLTNYSLLGGLTFGASATMLTHLDIHDRFELLAEVRVDEHNGGVFDDRGQILPDPHRPLRDVHGYMGVNITPEPDARMEVECRCIRRPPALVSDSDVPPLHAPAIEVLINLALSIACQSVSDPTGAATAKADYTRLLGVLKNRYGDLAPASQTFRRRSASTRRLPWTGYPWQTRSSS